jgi:Family of unknown function (DUF5565)
MQKIISLFQRNYMGDHLVRDEIVPGAEWVITGEGIPTRKWDGTCCKMEKGNLYKRHEVKQGKTPPEGFILVEGPDPITGNSYGWIKVGDGPEDKWFREGFMNTPTDLLIVDGTYELVGPRINGNRDSFEKHTLVLHGDYIMEDVPRTFDALKEWFATTQIEGIVWHHPDGRMVKIKKKDFGYKW